MDSIIDVLKANEIFIVVGLAVVVLILLIMLIVALKSIGKLEKKYKKMMRGAAGNNLEQQIVGYLDKIDEVKAESESIRSSFDEIDNRITKCIQKTAVLRYKAFEDVGSDLSFSISLLDNNNDGVVLTGIFGRHESTTYAKPIDKGISRYDLSEEENQVLQEAMGK